MSPIARMKDDSEEGAGVNKGIERHKQRKE
jgi:hypothetical protein